jgi:hypothetical protein
MVSEMNTAEMVAIHQQTLSNAIEKRFIHPDAKEARVSPMLTIFLESFVNSPEVLKSLAIFLCDQAARAFGYVSSDIHHELDYYAKNRSGRGGQYLILCRAFDEYLARQREDLRKALHSTICQLCEDAFLQSEVNYSNQHWTSPFKVLVHACNACYKKLEGDDPEILDRIRLIVERSVSEITGGKRGIA